MSLTILDSVIKASKKYYLETLLEEFKKTKIENVIIDNFEPSSSYDESNNE